MQVMSYGRQIQDSLFFVAHFQILIGKTQLFVEVPGRIVGFYMEGYMALRLIQRSAHEFLAIALAPELSIHGNIHQAILRDIAPHPRFVNNHHTR